MGISEIFKKNKTSWLYLLFIFILPFLTISIVAPLLVKHESYLQQAPPAFWLLVYFISCFTMAFGLTHTTFIALVSGYFLAWKSIPFVIISYLAASMLGYTAASRIDGGHIMDAILALPKAEPITRELKRNELKIILLSRLSPILPFAVTNLLLAFLKADFKKFVGGGFIGMLPRTLLFLWAGMEARDLRETLNNPGNNYSTKLATLALLLVSVFGLFYYVMRAIKKAGMKTDSGKNV